MLVTTPRYDISHTDPLAHGSGFDRLKDRVQCVAPEMIPGCFANKYDNVGLGTTACNAELPNAPYCQGIAFSKFGWDNLNKTTPLSSCEVTCGHDGLCYNTVTPNCKGHYTPGSLCTQKKVDPPSGPAPVPTVDAYRYYCGDYGDLTLGRIKHCVVGDACDAIEETLYETGWEVMDKDAKCRGTCKSEYKPIIDVCYKTNARDQADTCRGLDQLPCTHVDESKTNCGGNMLGWVTKAGECNVDGKTAVFTDNSKCDCFLFGDRTPHKYYKEKCDSTVNACIGGSCAVGTCFQLEVGKDLPDGMNVTSCKSAHTSVRSPGKETCTLWDPLNCGYKGQNCCAEKGVLSCFKDTVCNENTCEPCGSHDEACCPGEMCLKDAGLVCDNGVCKKPAEAKCECTCPCQAKNHWDNWCVRSDTLMRGCPVGTKPEESGTTRCENSNNCCDPHCRQDFGGKCSTRNAPCECKCVAE